jgi:hypothetical protein
MTDQSKGNGVLPRNRISRTDLLISSFLVLLIAYGLAEKSSGSPRHSIFTRSQEATSSVASQLPQNPGWYQIPNTKLAAVCPDYPDIQGNTGCAAVTAAWNGGIADTKRNRLVFGGGGHSDYFGNELYALNLANNPIDLVRLYEPTRKPDVKECPDAYYDGNPSARHTYNGLAYMPEVDRLFLFSGAKSICGYGGNDTWTLDLETLKWKRQDPTVGGPIGGCDGCVAAYDPNTHKVFVENNSALWSYDYSKNTYLRLNENASTDYHLTGVIDPVRRLFLEFGAGQLKAFSIAAKSKYAIQAWDPQVKGCEALLHAPYPGLAYDPALDRIVGWAGGDSVYLFDPDKKLCTQVTYPNGPGPQQGNGTHGRFRYFPELDVFALVNDWKQNAFVLRLPAKS